MIGRTNAGGGGGLNFKVVGGTTQPRNPKENTIWVNTDTEISGWEFSASEPENPAEGMVWIATANTGSVNANLLKKNAVTVCLISAKQYIGGSRSNKSAYIYQRASWVQFSYGLLYLYNTGDECTSVTGGWTANNVEVSVGVSVNALTITKNKSDMVLQQTLAQSGAGISTDKAVDITDYKTIFFDIAYNRGSLVAPWAVLSAHPNRSTVRDTVEKFLQSNTDGEIVPLDISALSGTNYITIGLYHQCTLTVRKVWLA